MENRPRTRTCLSVGAGLAAVYVALAIWVAADFQTAPLTGFDPAVMDAIHAGRNRMLTDLAMTDAFLFGPLGAIVVTALVAVLLAFALHQRVGALWLVLSVLITTGLTEIVKLAVTRQRPLVGRLPQFANEAGYSFSSGHSQFAAVLSVCTALVLLRVLHDRWQKVLVLVAAALITLMVMWSRVYVGVHYPSDTVAGLLLAVAWLYLTFPAYRALAARFPATEPVCEMPATDQ